MNPRTAQAAARLRAQGAGPARIARELGISYRQGRKICYGSERIAEETRIQNERRNAAKRAWERENVITCTSCGMPCGANSARQSRTSLCKSCLTNQRREGRNARGRQIEEWWAAGTALAEIAERLGWSVGSLASEMDWLRSNGFNLPYRYRLSRPTHASAALEGEHG